MVRIHTALLSVSLFAILAGSARSESPSNDLQGDALPAGAIARLGTTRLRHGGAIMRLAYSPDGKTLATLGQDNVVGLWDAVSGRELQRFQANEIGVGDNGGLAFSPDGATLAVTGWGVRLWDVAARREVPREVRHHNEVRFAAFSPDGKVLAVGGLDGTISLWEMPAVKKLRELAVDVKDEQWFLSAAFSPDGKVLASGSDHGLVRLWDVATGKEIRRLKQKGMLRSLAFAPDGKSLAVASIHDDDVHLWDPGTGKEIRRWKANKNGGVIAFRPDGKAVASAAWPGDDPTICLTDPATGRELCRLAGPATGVLTLAFSPDGKTLAAAGHGNAVRLWDPATGKQRLSFAAHEGSVVSVAFTADGKTLASAAGDHCVRVWDAATGRERRPRGGRAEGGQPAWLGPHKEAVDAVALSPDGKTLAAASRGGICLWDLVTGGELARPALREESWEHYGARTCAFSGDGRTLVYDDKGTVRLWDVPAGKPLRGFGQPGSVRAFRFTADDRRLMTAGRDGKVRSWEVATGKELYVSPAWAGDGCAFSPDGRTLAVGSGSAVLFDVATGKEVLRVEDKWPYEAVAVVALSPDGRTLATGGKDKDRTVRLWEVATGAERRRFVGHRGGVGALAFSGDGRLLASGSSDTTVLVWDVFGSAGPAKLRPEDLESLWEDLARPDAARAYRALCTLIASPRPAWALLKERVRPVPVLSAPAVARLIADLDSDEFATRERASGELARLEKAAEPALREALLKKPSAEIRRRVEDLLASPEWLRAVRAVEALERVATPEARQLLKALAEGAPEARLTREAQSALRRGEKPSAAR